MHAAFADDAVQIVKQTVKTTSSFLRMNAPVRALIGLLRFALAPGMHAEHHRRHCSTPTAVGPRPAAPWGRASSPGEPPALGIKNSIVKLGQFRRKSVPHGCVMGALMHEGRSLGW